ncbi:MAG: HesA/MoeB/ThiF family protein [Gammaproteobacteria bacterium]|nr:MAG: HesA/MoeB/ThiF family protein [Gammaproteobacteria bacterium]
MSEAQDPGRVRYARHIALPQVGERGQQRLAHSSALLIGLGGLGATAALYLGNGGLGHLVINDYDRVDASNLPRQILYTPKNVGEFKTHAAAESLRYWNPDLRVSVLNRRLADDELDDAVQACDIVLDCSDNFPTRLRINAACARHATPLVSGAAIRFEGQLALFAHDGGGPCYQCLYTEADENLDDCAGQGILAPVAGAIGCMMATEAIKRLLGLPSELLGRLWVYDGLAGSARSIAIRPRPDCPVCGR